MDMDAHRGFMQLALDEARKAPPKPTNYCVGALLVDESNGDILSSGFTQELPGNTHAEQCCLQKFADRHGVAEEDIGSLLPVNTVLYTTMEPCNERLSGNLPCVDRILRVKDASRKLSITKVYSGVLEPGTFVQNEGQQRLNASGVECIFVEGFRDQILKVATSGHTSS